MGSCRFRETSFEAAKKPLDQQILAFLSKTPSAAYTAVEIYAGINGFDSNSALLVTALMGDEQRQTVFGTLNQTLTSLVSAGKVELAVIQSQQHFAISQPAPRQP